MADEREQRGASDQHAQALSLLRDLRSDIDYRVVAIIRDQEARRIDDSSEERRQREWMRGELESLERRIDQTINNLR